MDRWFCGCPACVAAGECQFGRARDRWPSANTIATPGLVLALVRFSRLLGKEALVLVVQRTLRTVEPAFPVLRILVHVPGIQAFKFRRNVRDGVVSLGPLGEIFADQSDDLAGEDILRPFSGG